MGFGLVWFGLVWIDLVWDLGSRGLRLPKRPKLKQVCANRSSIGLTPARRGSLWAEEHGLWVVQDDGRAASLVMGSCIVWSGLKGLASLMVM